MRIAGTIYSQHIEEPQSVYVIRVFRAPSWNVLFQPAHWEMWRVLAQTAEGALRIARYHFYQAQAIQMLGEA